eukprot:CAMPEP_0182526310 /NCGR_PEP_ID=MMETSP1323-20130603/3088_1 /TAXON_ID=236787 /ORGANISM="Florenciella parvula, Strain RCC1693" /LENGTH=148 /DNA_ID=CAMNT_0024735143 /DNA_START=297 /DNA_END=743 /DNA_ORIENTATION=-
MSSSSSETGDSSPTFSNHSSDKTTWHVEHASSPPQAPSSSISLSCATSNSDDPTSASTSCLVPSDASTKTTVTALGVELAYPRDCVPIAVTMEGGTCRIIADVPPVADGAIAEAVAEAARLVARTAASPVARLTSPRIMLPELAVGIR